MYVLHTNGDLTKQREWSFSQSASLWLALPGTTTGLVTGVGFSVVSNPSWVNPSARAIASPSEHFHSPPSVKCHRQKSCRRGKAAVMPRTMTADRITNKTRATVELRGCFPRGRVVSFGKVHSCHASFELGVDCLWRSLCS